MDYNSYVVYTRFLGFIYNWRVNRYCALELGRGYLVARHLLCCIAFPLRIEYGIDFWNLLGILLLD